MRLHRGISGRRSAREGRALSPFRLFPLGAALFTGIGVPDAFCGDTPTTITLHAAGYSLSPAAIGGNLKVHFGEAWAKSDFTAANKSQMNHLDRTHASYDPFAIYKTEGTIDFPNSWQFDGTAPYDADRLNPNPPNLPRDVNNDGTVDPGEMARDHGLHPDGTGNYRGAFLDNIPEGFLDFPDFVAEYGTFKALAQQAGRYYTTDAAGVIYKNGVPVEFNVEFEVPDRDGAPYDLAFIDTIDGNPPAADGSNLATINIAGNVAEGMKGIFYVNANVSMQGQGNPPNLTMSNPDASATATERIWLDGVFYSAGSIDMVGNRSVYGSVITERGFTGNGTMDIWHNADLAGGLPSFATRDLSSNQVCHGAISVAPGAWEGEIKGIGTGEEWYSYTPIEDGVTTLSLCGSSFDTLLTVFEDCPISGGRVIAFNDDACGLQSVVAFSAEGGTTYFIAVGVNDADSSAGAYVLSIEGPLAAELIWEMEPNDVNTDAGVITFEPQAQELRGSFAGRWDLWRFETSEPTLYVFNVSPFGCYEECDDPDIVLEIVNSAGDRLHRMDESWTCTYDGGKETLVVPALDRGVYYVAVVGLDTRCECQEFRGEAHEAPARGDRRNWSRPLSRRWIWRPRRGASRRRSWPKSSLRNNQRERH